jgi:hypothetical protein
MGISEVVNLAPPRRIFEQRPQLAAMNDECDSQSSHFDGPQGWLLEIM